VAVPSAVRCRSLVTIKMTNCKLVLPQNEGCPFLKQELSEHEIDLQTPLRKNMVDTRPKSFVRQLMSARRLVETVIGQLADRFNIEKVRARDLWHLTNRFVRKLLAHTVAVFLNYCLHRDPLQFEGLAQA